MPWQRILSVWCLLIAAESVSGVLCRLLLEPRVGVPMANQVALFIGLGLVFAICLATSRWIGARSRLGWMLVGLVWAALTFAFECLLGLALGHSWSRILADYDPARGGMMALGLIGMVYAPRFAAQLRGMQT